MKKVLLLYYSQTGQLRDIADSILSQLDDKNIEITYQKIEPKIPFPFPWRFIEFFDIFPESVYMDGCEIREPKNIDKDFDLIILAYTVWFLSPSLPISAFLNSSHARILKDKPVITLIACRNMWIMAQERVKERLKELGATLIDNIVLTDRGGSLATFITTPRWMLTGKKSKFIGLPKAGVDPKEIKRASRFGKALKDALSRDLERDKRPLLKGLEAVKVDIKLIESEKIGNRSFRIWGKLIKKFGKRGDKKRVPILILYIMFLITLIITVVPIVMIIKPIIRRLNRDKIKQQKIHFEEPSGSGKIRLRGEVLK
jgi:hypothetical protein